jgi:hypothetical protein
MIKRQKAHRRARYEDMEVEEWILGHCGSYARRQRRDATTGIYRSFMRRRVNDGRKIHY